MPGLATRAEKEALSFENRHELQPSHRPTDRQWKSWPGEPPSPETSQSVCWQPWSARAEATEGQPASACSFSAKPECGQRDTWMDLTQPQHDIGKNSNLKFRSRSWGTWLLAMDKTDFQGFITPLGRPPISSNHRGNTAHRLRRAKQRQSGGWTRPRRAGLKLCHKDCHNSIRWLYQKY